MLQVKIINLLHTKYGFKGGGGGGLVHLLILKVLKGIGGGCNTGFN